MPATGFLRPPDTNGVEILERQPDRVHDPVAARALRVGAVLFHPRSHGLRRPGRLLGERRHDGRRRRRRRADQVVENPLSAYDGRRAIRVRRHEQNAALAEQTLARSSVTATLRKCGPYTFGMR